MMHDALTLGWVTDGLPRWLDAPLRFGASNAAGGDLVVTDVLMNLGRLPPDDVALCLSRPSRPCVLLLWNMLQLGGASVWSCMPDADCPMPIVLEGVPICIA